MSSIGNNSIENTPHMCQLCVFYITYIFNVAPLSFIPIILNYKAYLILILYIFTFYRTKNSIKTLGRKYMINIKYNIFKKLAFWVIFIPKFWILIDSTKYS